MTFVLDEENEVADFLRSYKSRYFFFKLGKKEQQLEDNFFIQWNFFNGWTWHPDNR